MRVSLRILHRTYDSKLGQWAASRADLFPTLLCDRMGSLHSRGKAHPFSHTRRVVEHVFQRPFDEVFEEFEITPIGTGAIAQVCIVLLLSVFLIGLISAEGVSREAQERPHSPLASCTKKVSPFRTRRTCPSHSPAPGASPY